MKKRTTRCLALLLAVVMVLSVMPVAMAEGTAQTYTKVTSAAELTTGKYVLVTDTDYAPDYFDNGWVLATQPSVVDGKIENPTAGVWTLTVDTDGVVMTDAKELRLRRRAATRTASSLAAINGQPALPAANLPLPERVTILSRSPVTRETEISSERIRTQL